MREIAVRDLRRGRMIRMDCPSCGNTCDLEDSTISTIGANRGQKTGDIYYCEKCEAYWLHNYLLDAIMEWEY